MSGFFAIDRRSMPAPARLRPVGYKIALELMVRGRLRIREVPIGFRARRRGSSKMGWRQQRDFLRHLVRLYSHKLGGILGLSCAGLAGAGGSHMDVACQLALL